MLKGRGSPRCSEEACLGNNTYGNTARECVNNGAGHVRMRGVMGEGAQRARSEGSGWREARAQDRSAFERRAAHTRPRSGGRCKGRSSPARPTGRSRSAPPFRRIRITRSDHASQITGGGHIKASGLTGQRRGTCICGCRLSHNPAVTGTDSVKRSCGESRWAARAALRQLTDQLTSRAP